jgi:hypothetical protein
VSSIRALQQTAIAVATILDGSATVASVSGHGGAQCVRVSAELGDEALPMLVFQTANARDRGGLLGSYLVDVELFAVASSMQDASDLLAAAVDALDALAFASAGLDAIPETGGPSDAEPLDADDVPYPEAVGVAATLPLAVFLSPL